MPTYEYICKDCGHEMEVFQSMSDDRLKKCPECSEDALDRLIGTGAGIIFKGGGFYETDYKRDGSSNDKGSSEAKSEPKCDGKCDNCESNESAKTSSDSKKVETAGSKAG